MVITSISQVKVERLTLVTNNLHLKKYRVPCCILDRANL